MSEISRSISSSSHIETGQKNEAAMQYFMKLGNLDNIKQLDEEQDEDDAYFGDKSNRHEAWSKQ